MTFEQTFDSLEEYCRLNGWRGFDCYDGLNARWLERSGLRRSRVARTLWIQTLKRSPVNFRRLCGISPEDNPKALALFLLGLAHCGDRGNRVSWLGQIRELADRLVDLREPGDAPGGWGYPFPWQSRAFLAPRGASNIVVTTFSGLALLTAHQCAGENRWLEAVRGACRFVADKLVASDEDGQPFFSYVEGDRSQIYNATLLGARLLVEAGTQLIEPDWVDLGLRAARVVANAQGRDGSWTYGPRLRHRWVDSFHTGYNLMALEAISQRLGTKEFDGAIAQGYDFYRARFFTEDFAPRYYSTQTYPIDVHSAAVAILTFLSMNRFDALAHRWAAGVAEWTIRTMRDPTQGYFYFQKHRLYTNRIPYMRWSQAWMYVALAAIIHGNARIPSVARGSVEDKRGRARSVMSS